MGYLISDCHAGEVVRILVSRQGIEAKGFPLLEEWDGRGTGRGKEGDSQKQDSERGKGPNGVSFTSINLPQGR